MTRKRVNGAARSDKAGLDPIIDHFWRENSDRLMRRARRFANGRDDLAEDFVAASMLKVIAYIKGANQPVKDLESLAFLTLRHVAFDNWRQRRRETEGLASLAHDSNEETSIPSRADDVVFSKQMYTCIREFLKAETRDTQTLFQKRFLLDLSYAEISQELDISEPLARKRVQTLRQRLRASVESKNQHRSLTQSARQRLKGDA